MSVTREPEHFAVKLSSGALVGLVRSLLAGEPFAQFGDNCTITIERDRLYWLRSQVDRLAEAVDMKEKSDG